MFRYNPLNARAKVLGKTLRGHYTVEVWGAYPHDYVKTYTLAAKNEQEAAREGIREFNQSFLWETQKENINGRLETGTRSRHIVDG